MKITSVEIVPINQKHKGRLIFSTGPTPAADDFIIIRIKTDEGIEGIGSAYAFQPAPLLAAGASREGAMSLMKDMATVLIGQDPLRLSENLGRLERAISGQFAENWHILSHFDHALYDLKGKILNLPVYELLGGLRRESIPLEWIVSFLPTPGEVAEEAKHVVDVGYKAVKVHVNRDPVNAEERVRAVRKALGDDVPIAIDMGMAYNAADAARLLDRLDSEYGLNFAEQCLNPYDVSGHQTLRTKTKTPLTADHSGMSLNQAYEYIKLNVFDNFHCLITRVGGIGRAVKYCDLIETAHLNYQICNMDNSIAGAAGAHFAVSRSDRGGRYYDELSLYLYLHGTYGTKEITDDIVKEQAAVIKNGVLYAPKGPGLGVELDEEMMKRYAAQNIGKILVE
ncbi:MAG: mandelate racemase/muconate lactonizing enzyme family protein [Clostridiales Family XIII bacterium]|jgi:muconate cycloisomerase|nr:mandelate racemase/muconate lactonizing enzyme family protein [Clostridiales Family XIII bacterium]